MPKITTKDIDEIVNNVLSESDDAIQKRIHDSYDILFSSLPSDSNDAIQMLILEMSDVTASMATRLSTTVLTNVLSQLDLIEDSDTDIT